MRHYPEHDFRSYDDWKSSGDDDLPDVDRAKPDLKLEKWKRDYGWDK